MHHSHSDSTLWQMFKNIVAFPLMLVIFHLKIFVKGVELELKSEEGDYLISQITDRVRNLIICHVSLMYLLLLEETRQ